MAFFHARSTVGIRGYPIGHALICAVFLFMAASAAGCGWGEEETRRHSSTWKLLESRGLMAPDVEVVTNRLADIDREPFTLEEDTLFRPTARGSGRAYIHLMDVGVTGSGNVFVLDLTGHSVDVFDSGGKHLTTVGQALSGSGELSMGVRDVIVMGEANDEVMVRDSLWAHFVVFDEEAGFVRIVELDRRQGGGWRRQGSDDLLFHQLFRGWNGVLRINLSTEVVDTLFPFTHPPVLYAGVNGKPVLAPAHPWTVLGDGRVAYGVTERLELFLFDREGKVDLVIQTDRAPRRVSWRDRRAMRRLWDEHKERLYEAARMEVPPELQNLAFLSPRWPAFAEVFAGPDGTLWVQRLVSRVTDIRVEAYIQGAAVLGSPLSYGPLGSDEWDVFDGTGQYLGLIRMPDGANPLVYDDGFVYALIVLDGGGQLLRRYEVSPRGRDG